MASFDQLPGLRREYGVNAWTKGIFLLIGFGVAAGGIFGAFKISPLPGSGVLASVFALVPTSLGLYLLAYAFRSRLIIDGSRITVRGAINEKSADLSEIEGFRTISSRNGSYRQIYLKQGSGAITLSNSFSTDDSFSAWFSKIPDLDERDRQALLDQIAQQQDLGATPEERLGAVARAKTISIALLVLSVLLGVLIAFSDDKLGPSILKLCVVLLALAPLLSAWLVGTSPLLYTVIKKKKDPRGDVSFVVMIAGLAFIFRTSADHFVNIEPMLFTMAVVALALAALFFKAAQNGARGAIFAIVIFAGIYSYGTVAVTDVVFDDSPANPFLTTVVGGHASHGKSTTYYLRLAPWGPIDHEKDVSVPWSIYRRTHLGDNVCTTLHSGFIHAAWFRIAPCGDATALPDSTPSDLPR